MVLSAQAQRTWKVVTLVVTGATAFHCVLRTDYGPDRHVFTDLQAWYRDTVDRMVGIDAGAVEEERRAKEKTKAPTCPRSSKLSKETWKSRDNISKSSDRDS